MSIENNSSTTNDQEPNYPSTATSEAGSIVHGAARAASEAGDQIADAASDAKDQFVDAASDAKDQLVRQAERLLEAGRKTVELSSALLKQQAAGLTATTSDSIRSEPLKAVLIAIAAGAVLGMLMTRGRGDTY